MTLNHSYFDDWHQNSNVQVKPSAATNCANTFISLIWLSSASDYNFDEQMAGIPTTMEYARGKGSVQLLIYLSVIFYQIDARE